jgi:hypothetical protein
VSELQEGRGVFPLFGPDGVLDPGVLLPVEGLSEGPFGVLDPGVLLPGVLLPEFGALLGLLLGLLEFGPFDGPLFGPLFPGVDGVFPLLLEFPGTNGVFGLEGGVVVDGGSPGTPRPLREESNIGVCSTERLARTRGQKRGRTATLVLLEYKQTTLGRIEPAHKE